MNIKEFKTGLPVRKAVLGIDYGSKRMGLAVSDLSCTIATPYKILYRREISADMAELRKIMAEKEIGAVVMGLPLQMNGEEGEIAAEVRKFAAIRQWKIFLLRKQTFRAKSALKYWMHLLPPIFFREHLMP